MGGAIDLVGRWRPSRFDEVVGQRDVLSLLRTFVQNEAIRPPAILLHGSPGVGKTTIARILSRALLCEEPEGGEPCGACAWETGMRDFGILEIDTAQDRGIEAIRKLIDLARGFPFGKWRTIILDEAHRLTNDAETALLKTLEEPGPTTWILITTEPGQLSPAVRSRLTAFEITAAPNDELFARLRKIADAESIGIDDKAVRALVDVSGGCVRDAIKNLPLAAAGVMPGVAADAGAEFASDFLDAALQSDFGRCKRLVSDATKAFKDVGLLFNAILDHLVDRLGSDVSSDLSIGVPPSELMRVLDEIGARRATISKGMGDEAALHSVAAMLSRMRRVGDSSAGSHAEPAVGEEPSVRACLTQANGKPLRGKNGKVFPAKPCYGLGCEACAEKSVNGYRSSLLDSGVQAMVEVTFVTPGEPDIQKKRVDRILSTFGASVHAWYFVVVGSEMHQARIWMRSKDGSQLDSEAFESAVRRQDQKALVTWMDADGDPSVPNDFLIELSSAAADRQGGFATALEAHLEWNPGSLVRGSSNFFRDAAGAPMHKREAAMSGF